MWLRDGALRGDIPTIERMTNDPRVFPYRWGQALWAYVGGRWGDLAIGQILKLTGQGVPYPTAFERILNITLEELSADWHTSIRRAYLPLLAERPEGEEDARAPEDGSPGLPLTLIDRPYPTVTMALLNDLGHGRNRDLATAHELASCPALSPFWQRLVVARAPGRNL